MSVKDSIMVLKSSVFSSNCMLITVISGRHQIATDCAWKAGTCATAENILTVRPKSDEYRNIPEPLVQARVQLAIAFFVSGAAWPVGGHL